MNKLTSRLIVSLAFVLIASPAVRAHCDTLEGPVISAARAALAKGDVTPVLKWVKADDEASIRDAFDRTLVVRKHSPEAATLADTWFFETLVRIHRAGEGAPYTGLKSGAVEEKGTTAADRALESGKVEEVIAQTAAPLQAALAAKFARVQALKAHANDTVESGRAYVEAYVEYVHFAERLADLASEGPAISHAAHEH